MHRELACNPHRACGGEWVVEEISVVLFEELLEVSAGVQPQLVSRTPSALQSRRVLGGAVMEVVVS